MTKENEDNPKDSSGLLNPTLVKQGDSLFRWRSIIPGLAIPILVWEMYNYRYFLESEIAQGILVGICFGVSALGLFVRSMVQGYAARGTSGRNTKKGQKADVLNTTGMYTLCRNPLYLGNFILTLGFVLFFHSFYLVALYTLSFCLYYERIILREEDYLHHKFGEPYARWASGTPVFIPRLTGWKSPEIRFSFRKVLRREHPTVLWIVSILTAFQFIADWRVNGEYQVRPLWAIFLGAAVAQYLIIRCIKKFTGALKVSEPAPAADESH